MNYQLKITKSEMFHRVSYPKRLEDSNDRTYAQIKSKVSKSVNSEHGVLEFFCMKIANPSLRRYYHSKIHNPSKSHDSDRFLGCVFFSFKIRTGVFAKMKSNVQVGNFIMAVINSFLALSR